MSKLPKFLWLAAIVLLFAATMRLPYGYYTFLRISICGFCGLVALFCIAERSLAWASAFALIAILFNPIIPVYLKRETWFWLDLGVATIIAAHLGFRSFTEGSPSKT
jgi:hypothetical protein